LIIIVSATTFVFVDSSYGQKYTEPQMEINNEIGRLFSKEADMIIDAATQLGGRKPEPTRAVPFLLRALKDLESNRMEVVGNKSKVVTALVNALKNITGQTIGKDIKKWEKYIASYQPKIKS
jgi:hypothetical protein